MSTIGGRVIIVGLLVLGGATVARAGTYSDASGFSFTYPDGWTPVTGAALGAANNALPPEVKAWIDKNRMDLSRIAMTLIRNGHEDFLESVNVVVENQEIPVNNNTAKQLSDVLAKQYQGMGIAVEGLQSRVQQVAGRDAVVVDFGSRLPGTPFPMRQRQVMLPGGGKTYIITCTAKAETFERYAPVFDGILSSFQAPAASARGFDWNRVLMTTVVGAIIGGVIGGGIAIAKKLSGKSNSGRKRD